MEEKDRAKGNDKDRGKTAKQADTEDDSCRCKEVSRKSYPELLKMMLRDLAFWKKRTP